MTSAELRDRVATALDALGEEQTRTYCDQPIPCDLDGTVSSLVDGLIKSTPGEREQMLDEWFDHRQLGALSTFCIRMCAMAIREASEDLLLVGLTAQGLEGYRVDFRDGGIQALSVAYQTALKLSLDPREIFEQASTFASPAMAGYMMELLDRPDLDEILPIMRYREGEGPDGFRYEWMGGPEISPPT